MFGLLGEATFKSIKKRKIREWQVNNTANDIYIVFLETSSAYINSNKSIAEKLNLINASTQWF